VPSPNDLNQSPHSGGANAPVFGPGRRFESCIGRVVFIYNRRFEAMQLIGVYAAEVTQSQLRLDPLSTRSTAGVPTKKHTAW